MPLPIQPELISIDHATLPGWHEKKVEAGVLRLDRMHHQISGNKWFKLRFYLEEAKKANSEAVITFGGAWSNHLLATAAACRMEGMRAVGMIRGERPVNLSATLLAARECGMDLHFLSREDYRAGMIPADWLQQKVYIIPEGGYGALGCAGAATITKHFHAGDWSHFCSAVGTGTMLAGLASALPASCTITGINVLKNPSVETAIDNLLAGQDRNYTILHDFHFGGYARYNKDLLHFMNGFYSATSIPSDFVYTGKLFYAVNTLIQSGYFPPGSKILLVHSGGLQGNSSLEKGTLIW